MKPLPLPTTRPPAPAAKPVPGRARVHPAEGARGADGARSQDDHAAHVSALVARGTRRATSFDIGLQCPFSNAPIAVGDDVVQLPCRHVALIGPARRELVRRGCCPVCNSTWE